MENRACYRRYAGLLSRGLEEEEEPKKKSWGELDLELVVQRIRADKQHND